MCTATIGTANVRPTGPSGRRPAKTPCRGSGPGVLLRPRRQGRGEPIPELVERLAGEDLLLGNGPLRTPTSHKAHGPVQQCGQPVLEPDEVDEVDDQPHQPGGQPAEAQGADAGDRAE